MRQFLCALILLGSSTCYSSADELDPLRQRGEALVKEMCGECHAIGKAGQNLHAGAPAFRSLNRRLDLDTFQERLRDGLTSSHRDMPTFRFVREEARAVVAYLRSIQ